MIDIQPPGIGSSAAPASTYREQETTSTPSSPTKSNQSAETQADAPTGTPTDAVRDVPMDVATLDNPNVSNNESRQHVCEQCGKGFKRSSGLKQHQYSHSDIKLFKCEVCLKAFTIQSNLCRHRRLKEECRQNSSRNEMDEGKVTPKQIPEEGHERAFSPAVPKETSTHQEKEPMRKEPCPISPLSAEPEQERNSRSRSRSPSTEGQNRRDQTPPRHSTSPRRSRTPSEGSPLDREASLQIPDPESPSKSDDLPLDLTVRSASPPSKSAQNNDLPLDLTVQSWSPSQTPSPPACKELVFNDPSPPPQVSAPIPLTVFNMPNPALLASMMAVPLHSWYPNWPMPVYPNGPPPPLPANPIPPMYPHYFPPNAMRPEHHVHSAMYHPYMAAMGPARMNAMTYPRAENATKTSHNCAICKKNLHQSIGSQATHARTHWRKAVHV